MDSIVGTVLAWFAESLWERLLLCAETATIVIGGPWAWFHRHSLKKQIGDLQTQLAEILTILRKLPDKPEAEQRKIVKDVVLSIGFKGKGEGKFGPAPTVHLTRRDTESKGRG